MPPRLTFHQNLAKAHTEEDVKASFVKEFRLAVDTSDHHDLFTPEILFEFKFDQNFQNPKILAKILAQALFYVHRIKYGVTDQFAHKDIPSFICLADRNESILTETATWSKWINREDFDWDLPPSSPDEKLISELSTDQTLLNIHVFCLDSDHDFAEFSSDLRTALDPQRPLDLPRDKKIITESNFENIFEHWLEAFGETLRNGTKLSKYFLCDISGKTHLVEEQGKVMFNFGDENAKVKKVLLKNYHHFWDRHEHISDSRTLQGIIAKLDRINDETIRRFEGEFFTPVRFAELGLKYLEKTLGKEWWLTHKIWDMAGGTGNLEDKLPAAAWSNLHISSLHSEDVEHCQKLFPGAHCFQYDFLNDDVDRIFTNPDQQAMFFDEDWKLPQNLRDELADPNNKWVVFINPPFATSTDYGEGSKATVSDTKVRQKMLEADLGISSQELFAQFLFRIHRQLPHAHLGLFATLKYLNSPANHKFRDDFFHFTFKNGFIFSSENFHGTKGKFPVSFLVWDLDTSADLRDQSILVDVFDRDRSKIGKKHIAITDKSQLLNVWAERPKQTEIMPPLKSAIQTQFKNIRLEKLAPDAIGFLGLNSNDFQSQNQTILFSAPFWRGNGFSITPTNFEQAMLIHTVRRLPRATWINDRDQFRQPSAKLPPEFISDCVIWSLFSGSNQTSSLSDILFHDKTFQIPNHFFPFLVADVATWKIADSDFATALAREDTFVVTWISSQKLSPAATEVMQIGTKIWQTFFAELHRLDTPKFKITRPDAGWWQVRMTLADQHLATDLFEKMKIAHKKLGNQILPDIFNLGFLDPEIEPV